MYKIKHGMCQETLGALVPQATKSRTNYPLRSGSSTSLMKTRTKSLYESYFPATIREWNKIPEEKREVGSLEQFKENITPEKTTIPKYIYYGRRRPQILQTRMRLRNSDLNEDLYEINLSDTPECRCGEGIEDADHFLRECKTYLMQRAQIYLKYGINLTTFDAEERLEGNPEMTDEYNTNLFEAVHTFIENSGRFR